MPRAFKLCITVVVGVMLLPCPAFAQSEQQALALMKEAKALEDGAKSRADLEKAAAKFEEALKICEQAKSKKCAGVAAVGIGNIYKSLSEYTKALEYYEKSLNIMQNLREEKFEGVILNNIGLVYERWGQHTKALEYYEKSLGIARKVFNLKSEGTSLGNIGAVYSSKGQYNKALEYSEKSLEIAKKVGDIRGEGCSLGAIGLVYRCWGQYAKSLAYYEKALSVSQKLGDVKGEAIDLGNIGEVYSDLGQYPKALEYYEKALVIRQRLGDVRGEGIILNKIGKVYASKGRTEEALTNFQKAIEIYTRTGRRADWPKDLIGNLFLDRNQPDKAEPFIREAGYKSSLGRLSLARSDYIRAKDYYERVLARAEQSRDVDLLFVGCTGLGRVNEALENYGKAEEYYEKGMNLTEEIRSSLLPSERKNFFDVRIGGFYRLEPSQGLTRVRMKLNQSSGSIDSSEVTRARMFSDKIAPTGQAAVSGVPKSILEKEDQLVSRVAALKKELAKTDKEKQGGRYENLSKEVQESENDLKAFVEMLWDKHKAYAAVKYPRPVTLKESALRPDECVVMFDVSNEGVGVKLVRGKKILQTFYSDWPANELESDVKKFRDPFERRDLKSFDPKLGEALYKKLLARVLMDVPPGTPITIIPDGVLAILPFEALVVGEKSTAGDKITYVSDLYPISYYQSITALTLARTMGEKKKAVDRVLVIADPVFQLKDERAQSIKQTEVAGKDKEYIGNIMNAIEEEGSFKLRRLPETAVLAADLKSLYGSNAETYTDFKANKADFLKKIAPRLEQYSAVVFATHGVFSTRVPGLMEPFLALTMVPHGTDGFLKMSDVMSLKMNADIVALTACQTGLGKDLSGEGIMSMGRAFQYAGARTVLMSLWSVAEKSSVILVESFFRNLKQGKSKLESLKLAREEIRKQGHDHPFFWAPFILVGEVD